MVDDEREDDLPEIPEPDLPEEDDGEESLTIDMDWVSKALGMGPFRPVPAPPEVPPQTPPAELPPPSVEYVGVQTTQPGSVALPPQDPGPEVTAVPAVALPTPPVDEKPYLRVVWPPAPELDQLWQFEESSPGPGAWSPTEPDLPPAVMPAQTATESPKPTSPREETILPEPPKGSEAAQGDTESTKATPPKVETILPEPAEWSEPAAEPELPTVPEPDRAMTAEMQEWADGDLRAMVEILTERVALLETRVDDWKGYGY